MNIMETISNFLVIYFQAYSILAMCFWFKIVSYNLFDIINGALLNFTISLSSQKA